MTQKKSIFIQVQWYNPAELKAHLQHIYEEHRDRSDDDYIYNVVLDEIGANGVLSPNLDIILPYLPGGKWRAFDNVFVGSHYVPWTGEGNAYYQGMQNASHRWANLTEQRKLWEAFAARYPSLTWHCYINHEGVLDYFDEPWLRACYEAYLLHSVNDAHTIRPGAAVLWAPAVWAGRELTYGEEAGVRRTFENVARLSIARGVTWLHVQDMQGRVHRPSMWTVVRWYRELRALGLFDSLRVNMELFKTLQDGTVVPAPQNEVEARERYYARYGVPIGASWELRYWYANHVEIP